MSDIQRPASDRSFVLCVVLLLVLGYHSLAFTVWQFRNPKANAMTVYTHYFDVMTWRKLEKFQ